MTNVTNKAQSPASPASNPGTKSEEARRPFGEVTNIEKIFYLFAKVPAKFYPALYTPDRWNPERVALQNQKSLEKTTKFGISALTALKVGLGIAMVGLIVGFVFAAPFLGIGLLKLICVSCSILMMTALLYNFILLIQTPSNESFVYFDTIDKSINDYFEQIKDQRSPEQVHGLAMKNEYEQNQARKETDETVEMGQTNEPQPVIPMMPQQAPALAANHQPYAPLSQEKIEMPQMNEPQNLHPQNPAGSE